MQLKDYINEKGLKYREVANELGVHYQHIFKIISKKTYPGYRLAKRIEHLTEGKVTLDELIPPIPPKKRCPCCGKVVTREMPGQQKKD